MKIESLLVFALVAACFVYALWQLLPQAIRRILASALQRLPLSARVSAYFAAAALQPSGCHCSDCEHSSGKRYGGGIGPAKTLRFHRRKS